MADALDEAVAEAVALAEGEADAEALAEALADAEGLAVSTLTGLVSSKTPQTLQVLCSLPIRVVVASSTTVQSEATWPGAGIISV